jgi:hypothetical protein
MLGDISKAPNAFERVPVLAEPGGYVRAREWGLVE